MKRLLVIFALLVMLGFVTACGEPEPTPEPETKGAQGTLRVAITTLPNSLDLPRAAERQARNVSWQIYDSLVWIDDDGQVVPALAESWELSDDRTEYTFKLRQHVTFHNGEEFNADAVVFSWERGKQEQREWRGRWRVADSVQKIDDLTVKVTTAGREPNPVLLEIIAEYWAIVPPKYIQEVGEDGFAEHAVGTGPFKFVEWLKGDRIILQANENYWQEGLPKVETLIFHTIPDSSARMAAIKRGEVDLVTRLSAEEAIKLRGVDKVEVKEYPVDRVYYIAFNNLSTGKGQPTEDPLVRQAMNIAVDVDAIINNLFDGHGRPLTGFVTSHNLGYDETLSPFGYSPDRARELLAEAGYPNGFEIGFACPTGVYSNFEQVCEAVKHDLAKVGIQANLELNKSEKHWQLQAEKELPPLFGDSWSETSGEALPRLQGALGGWETEFSAWSDPNIDQLLDKIGTTVDDNARADFYVELQRYMQQNPPFIYLYEPVTYDAINPNYVQNYKPRAAENYYLQDVSVVFEALELK